jgi:hypothetical protein
MDSPADEIERLARLRDSGDITDAEYELLKSQIVGPSDPPVADAPKAVPQAPTRPADELYESFIEYSPHGRSVGGANLEIGYAPTDLTRRVIPWTQTGNGMPVSIYAHPHHVEIWLRVNRWVETGECLIKVLVLPPHLAGLEELREAQASLFETVENRIDDPEEGPRYWAGTPISIERRPRYLRVRLGILGPDDLVCIGRQPALYSGQTNRSRMKDSRTQSQGPSLTTVKETLEQVLLAPSELSAPNYVSQLLESEGKFPTAPAVPSVEWRREEEQREYERERREAEARHEAERKKLEELGLGTYEERKAAIARRLAELEADKEGLEADIARREAAQQEAFETPQTAMVLQLLDIAVEVAFDDPPPSGGDREEGRDQLREAFQRDIGRNSTLRDVCACIEDCCLDIYLSQPHSNKIDEDEFLGNFGYAVSARLGVSETGEFYQALMDFAPSLTQLADAVHSDLEQKSTA